MTILFSTINAQQLAQAGVQALNARQNKSVIMTGNPESTDYRKSVFPALRGWMTQVFNAHKAGLITKQEGIELFTFIRGKAVKGILAYRAKNSVDHTAIALEKANARIAELEAQLAQSKATTASLIQIEAELTSKINSQIKTIAKQGRQKAKLKATIAGVVEATKA